MSKIHRKELTNDKNIIGNSSGRNRYEVISGNKAKLLYKQAAIEGMIPVTREYPGIFVPMVQYAVTKMIAKDDPQILTGGRFDGKAVLSDIAIDFNVITPVIQVAHIVYADKMIAVAPVEWGDAITVTCYASTREIAQDWMAELERMILKENQYRGKCLHVANGNIEFSNIPKVDWDDVILDANVKYDIRLNTVAFLGDKKLAEVGVTKRGLVLYGQPGTGKTSVVKAIFSELNDANVSRVYVTAESFRRMAVNDLFNLLPYLGKTVLAFEDIDMIGVSRDECVAVGGNTLLGDLLTNLDGMRSYSDPIVTIATTNKIDLLDDALANRPCRFDRKIMVCLPTSANLKEIYRKLSGIIVSDDLIKLSTNFTGSHVVEVVNTAKILAAYTEASIEDCLEEACNIIKDNFFPEQKVAQIKLGARRQLSIMGIPKDIMIKKAELGTQYFVSRQIYWGVPEEEANAVEIAIGGYDVANPGMLVETYENLGEGKEYNDPRDAVKAAIAIAHAWQKDTPELKINIAYGDTLGMVMPFESSTEAEVVAWGEKEYESLYKCPECGKVTMDTRDGKWSAGYVTENDEFISNEEYIYCSEKCADKNTTYYKNERESKLQKKADENDNTLFNVDTVSSVLERLRLELQFPYAQVQYSMLGGAENISISIVASLDEKDTWFNGILQNSRYAMFTISCNGKVEQFQKSYKINKSFRARTCKSIEDIIKALNAYCSDTINENIVVSKRRKGIGKIADIYKDYTAKNLDDILYEYNDSGAGDSALVSWYIAVTGIPMFVDNMDFEQSLGRVLDRISEKIKNRISRGKLQKKAMTNLDKEDYDEEQQEGIESKRKLAKDYKLPKGWTEASMKSLWKSVGGTYEKCVESISGVEGIDDPEAFATWCEKIATGKSLQESIASRLIQGWVELQVGKVYTTSELEDLKFSVKEESDVYMDEGGKQHFCITGENDEYYDMILMKDGNYRVFENLRLFGSIQKENNMRKTGGRGTEYFAACNNSGMVEVLWEEVGVINKTARVEISWYSAGLPRPTIEEVEGFIEALFDAIVFAKKKAEELGITAKIVISGNKGNKGKDLFTEDTMDRKYAPVNYDTIIKQGDELLLPGISSTKQIATDLNKDTKEKVKIETKGSVEREFNTNEAMEVTEAIAFMKSIYPNLTMLSSVNGINFYIQGFNCIGKYIFGEGRLFWNDTVPVHSVPMSAEEKVKIETKGSVEREAFDTTLSMNVAEAIAFMENRYGINLFIEEVGSMLLFYVPIQGENMHVGTYFIGGNKLIFDNDDILRIKQIAVKKQVAAKVIEKVAVKKQPLFLAPQEGLTIPIVVQATAMSGGNSLDSDVEFILR